MTAKATISRDQIPCSAVRAACLFAPSASSRGWKFRPLLPIHSFPQSCNFCVKTCSSFLNTHHPATYSFATANHSQNESTILLVHRKCLLPTLIPELIQVRMPSRLKQPTRPRRPTALRTRTRPSTVRCVVCQLPRCCQS